MPLKGLEPLRLHLPILRTPAGTVRLLLAFAGVFLATALFFLLVDLRFAEWMPDGEIVILALGFLILSRFFSQRTRYQQKYGELAFQQALTRFSIPGLGIIAASVLHLGYIAGPVIPNVWWKPILVAIGWVFLITGIVLWLRSVAVFGLDNLLMLHAYDSDGGRVVDSGVYGVIRHPVYAAAMDIGFGLAMIHASWYALLVTVILPLFFLGWIRLFEEPELLRRFPDYAAYRKSVPAFIPRLANVPRFFRFFIAGQ